MFKKGDRVVCINNHNDSGPPFLYLTKENIYIVDEVNSHIIIHDDKHEKANFRPERFIPLSTWINYRLGDILHEEL